MLTRGLKIFTVRGIDVRIDASWLIIAALITWSFWGRYTEFYDRGGKVALIMAVAGATLFFLSVLLHELAHSFEAQHRGVHVGGITLFLFGGVTESSFDVKRPVDEFALTAVGPFTSFVLAAGFGLAATGADEAGLGAVAEVSGQLGWINLALGLFNLIPGAPLDGGRILRAAVWKITGDRRRSIVVAAWSGRMIGFFLIALGIGQLLFVPGAFIGGVWLAFIGWFLSRAAQFELVREELGSRLSDVQSGELVTKAQPLPADATIDDAVQRWKRTDAPDVMAVHDSDSLVGAIAFDDARLVPESERRTTTVGSMMTPVTDLPSVAADAPADEILDAISRKPIVVITEGGRPVGLVSAERLLQAAQRADLLERAGARR